MGCLAREVDIDRLQPPRGIIAQHRRRVVVLEFVFDKSQVVPRVIQVFWVATQVSRRHDAQEFLSGIAELSLQLALDLRLVVRSG